MINVKLVVTFIFYICVSICRGYSSSQYCEICSDHTLCKYTIPGPSRSCKDYDYSSLLTNDEINDITQKINERRNFIALGVSKDFPSAANMNKIYWSDKLADIAQRWADQCDASVRPHEHDTCRDLENMKVGQNIATVFGPSSGLNVKSLIEMWFMQILDYSGNVTYYNQSTNKISDYFTQLIWAETNTVGCGKVKFYDASSTLIERLICNFAPKGNIHGKPIYTIGYAATQCNVKTPDINTFPGLCDEQPKLSFPEQSSSFSPVTSLLRIINLANDSGNLDPIINMKQIKTKDVGYKRDGNQKPRQVALNERDGSFQRALPTQYPIFWINTDNNISRRHELHQNEQQKGHSRIYHGHYHGTQSLINQNQQDFTKIDFTTLQFSDQTRQDMRRCQQQNEKCTRKLVEPCTDSTKICVSNRCTRGEKKELCQSSPYSKSSSCCSLAGHQCPPVPNSCVCNNDKNDVCTSHTQCTRHTKNQCCSMKCSTIPYSTCASTNINARKAAEFHYYDFLPKRPLRSGDEYDKTTTSHEIFPKTRPSIKTKIPKLLNKLNRYNSDIQKVKEIKHYSKPFENHDSMDYSYHSFDSSKRERRAPENQKTLKPFWQIDESVKLQSPIQLKAIKYTTLVKRKNRRTTKSQTTKIPLSTETIIEENTTTKKLLTERYLSFDELMHLRKFSIPEDYNARRKDSGKDVKENETTTGTTTTIKTTEYTANTPFFRKKYCTRKLTCTWTSPTITDSDGHVVTYPGGGGGGGKGGSRTPPGYVEGCTRTATCSRINLDRNKIFTDEVSTMETTLEDEDYCEKRSLNRRNLNADVPIDIYFGDEIVNKEHSSFLEETTISASDELITESRCECSYEPIRSKRHDDYDEDQNSGYRMMSYGELLYLIVREFNKPWDLKNTMNHYKNCACNTSSFPLKSYNIFIVSMLVFNFQIN